MKRITVQNKVEKTKLVSRGKRLLRYYIAPWLGCALLMIAVTSALSLPAMAQCGGPTGSCSEAAFDQDLIRNAAGNLFMLIEGAFGALIMIVSGIGAIFAASMGAYRAAVGMLVVAVGSFILRSLVSLFFGIELDPFEADF